MVFYEEDTEYCITNTRKAWACVLKGLQNLRLPN